MHISLSGTRALVCGASQGIGEAVARQFAAAGAEVVLLARSQEKLKAIHASLPHKERHSILVVDLMDRDDLQRKVNGLLSAKSIDILIHNSGGPKGGPLLGASEVEFLSAFQNHILSISLLAKLLTPGMKAKKFGRFVQIISTSVKAPIPNLGVSNTIRGAVASWAKSFSLEVAPYGITANNVLPGYTQTPRLEALAEATADRLCKTVAEIKGQWQAATPMNRFATPEEVAQAVTFLASPQASFITGINLPVDGGRTPCL